jgi:integrase
MSVYKNAKGKWTAYIRYKDWQGKSCVKKSEVFKTRREAQEFEREFIAKKSKDIKMGFSTFVDIYIDDVKPQLKENTMETKIQIINSHILPYFEAKCLCDISSTDVLQWQNELLNKSDENGRAYSPTYLRTIQNQLNAIFNHAVKYYDLPKNPCRAVKKMGRAKAPEMLFWTKNEYKQFIETMKNKPVSFYIFEVLYWTGIREGELLALTKDDFDLDKRTLTINKSYQRIKRKEVITTPKTEKSNRVIDLPEFLCDEMEDYFGMLYKLKGNARLFQVTKSYLHHELDRGCRESGVKRIRVHDIRHSHVAHLIELGFSPLDIAERMGHESAVITMNTYAHLYPRKQKKMADRLNEERNNEEGDV